MVRVWRSIIWERLLDTGSGDPLSFVSPISDLDLYFVCALVNQRQMGQVTVKRSGVPAVIQTLDPQKNPWLVARMHPKHRIDSVLVL